MAHTYVKNANLEGFPSTEKLFGLKWVGLGKSLSFRNENDF